MSDETETLREQLKIVRAQLAKRKDEYKQAQTIADAARFAWNRVYLEELGLQQRLTRATDLARERKANEEARQDRW